MCQTHPHTASLTICTNTETPIFIFQAQESACLMARIDRIQALSPLIQGHIIHITTTFPFPKLPSCHTQKQKPTKIRPLNGRIPPEKNQLSGQFAIHRTGKKQRTFGDIVAPVFKKHRFLKTMHFCCLSQCIVACLQILMNLDESRCFISKWEKETTLI